MTWIPNGDGTPPSYPHPCVFLGESPRFAGKLLVLGITTDLSRRRKHYSVDMPWSCDHQCETGLYLPCSAQAHWTDHVLPGDVTRRMGSVPKAKRLEIAEALQYRSQHGG